MKPRKPTLDEKIAAWKAAKDIVLDELWADIRSAVRADMLPDEAAVVLVAEASRTAALMAPWNVEED